jgi:hypothetical protein
MFPFWVAGGGGGAFTGNRNVLSLKRVFGEKVAPGGIATFPGDARLRHDGGNPPSRQSAAAKKTQRRTTANAKGLPRRH